MQKNIDVYRDGSSRTESLRRPIVRKAVLASAVALAILGVSLDAHALALGALTVRSALGEPLRAEIEIPQMSSEEASSLRASLGTPDAFRAAGVDYSPALSGTRVTLQQRSNGQAYLQLAGDRPVNEPFVGLVIEASWAGGRVVRDYTMLLDPPERAALPAVVATQPQVAASPVPAPALAAAHAPVTVPTIPTVAQQMNRKPAQRPRTASSAPSGDTVTVQRGATASALAIAHGLNGVSLDQMLVAMLQANPDAFIRGNVNLIKAGAVIQMPSAAQAQATSRTDARRVVLAQSQDFQAYRSSLAQRARPTVQAEASGQSVSGQVQAQVDDRSEPAPSPDRLTISRADEASASESATALSREAQEQSERVAELDRNLSELARLQAESGTNSAENSLPGIEVPVATSNALAEKLATELDTTVVDDIAADIAADSEGASDDGESAATGDVTADNDAEAAESVSDDATASANEEITDESETAMSAAEASTPTPASTPVSAPAESFAEPSFFDKLKENPLLPAGGLLIALLALWGLYRSRQRNRDDMTLLDSDFIESRMQPDSFFGASGGQRVDTREGASGRSSIAYSPSQLDAVGDVDPVAEADVYLAYGRDMQAEEILKEALLTQPDRVSLHRKLAEIYAKRRDVRALEAIATEAHGLTNGEGPDWQEIASLGDELDPENPLYKPGGKPRENTAAENGRPIFGADTEPQSAQTPPPPSTMPSMPAPADNEGNTARTPLDLNLDLDSTLEAAAPSEVTRLQAAEPVVASAAGLASAAAAEDTGPAKVLNTEPMPFETPSLKISEDDFVDLDLDFAPPSELPTDAKNPSDATSDSGMIEFDMDSLSAELDSRSGADLSTMQPDHRDGSPLSTKLSLAREFHIIGDTEGARALAQEVVAEATGALKAQAQRFLEDL